jgi:Tfp pilus assembly protein PilV
MLNRKGGLIAAAVIVVVILFAASTRQNQEQQLADSIAQRQRGQAAEPASRSAVGSTWVVRLSDSVIADSARYPREWVAQLEDRHMPIARFPDQPTAEGLLKPAEPIEDGSPREPSQGYLGAAACAACHEKRHASFIETAHFQTSRTADLEAVLGPVESPGNRVASTEPELSFTVTHDGKRMHQQVELGDWRASIPADVIFGSGKLAQTFLYWHGDGLYQAHLSYFPEQGRWVTSPGYKRNSADFSREIVVECIECHATYIARKKELNFYHRETAIWGISCERCHGPGQQHVEHHAAHPDEKQPRHIVHPGELPRERQLDLCAQCHSGEYTLLTKPFRFRPGDAVDDFHRLVELDDSGEPDVHTSNQMTRLAQSRCFQQSEMTCTTCHNPHELQRGNTPLFSRACLQCHEVQHCGAEVAAGVNLADDCIGCHMPETRNVDLKVLSADDVIVRSVDHFIRVVEEEADTR